MKTQFLKNAVPFGVIALALSGAFATTSMQKASAVFPQPGFQLDAMGNCSDTPVSCDTQDNDIVCRVNDLTGPQAWGKNTSGECVIKLYRPE